MKKNLNPKKNKFSKNELIMAMRSKSLTSNSNSEFRDSLYVNLESKIASHASGDQIVNLIISFMNKQKGFFVLLFVMGFALSVGGVLFGYSKLSAPSGDIAVVKSNNESSSDEGLAGGDLSAGLKVALVEHESLAEVQSKFSFDFTAPKYLPSGVKLTKVESAAGELDAGTIEHLYLTYTKNGETFLKIFASKPYGGYASEGTKVDLAGIDGYFMQVPDWEELNSPDAITFDGGESPRSFIDWETSGGHYEVSEFGTMSQSELEKVAESMR